VLFRSHGGDDVDANLCCLCRSCHDAIHARREHAWRALESYVLSKRGDTVLYLTQKLGRAAASFFR
jgi:hypothetical protein